MGDKEGSKELAGHILREADAGRRCEALYPWAVGGVRIDSDREGGDADDGADVGEVGDVVEAEIALLLPGERNDYVGRQKLLIGIDQFAAGLAQSGGGIGFDADDSYRSDGVAGRHTIAG